MKVKGFNMRMNGSVEALKAKAMFAIRMDRRTLALCLATGSLVAALVWYVSGVAVLPLLHIIYP